VLRPADLSAALPDPSHQQNHGMDAVKEEVAALFCEDFPEWVVFHSFFSFDLKRAGRPKPGARKETGKGRSNYRNVNGSRARLVAASQGAVTGTASHGVWQTQASVADSGISDWGARSRGGISTGRGTGSAVTLQVRARLSGARHGGQSVSFSFSADLCYRALCGP
jgi:hypothetical protein